MRIDYVVNFAAESHVDRSITDPNIFLQTNVFGTLNLLNHAKAAWCIGDDQYKEGVKYLQVSTDEVYGSLGAEGYFTEETPLNPHSPYSASKTSADLFVQAYHDTYRAFIMPTHIIYLTVFSTIDNHVDCFAMILHIKPIPHIQPVTIYIL